jgi:hypothetical protein
MVHRVTYCCKAVNVQVTHDIPSQQQETWPPEGDAMTKRSSGRSVVIQILVFCIVTACCLVGEYQSFGGECCFHLQSLLTSVLKMGAACSSETLVSVTYKTARCHNPYDHSSSLVVAMPYGSESYEP